MTPIIHTNPDWMALYLVAFLLSAWWAHWLILWPGTLLHELLHWTVGQLLDAKPSRISLLPRGDTLGEVVFKNLDDWKIFPVALAPLLAIPILLVSWPWFQTLSGWYQITAAWIAGSITVMSLPSRQDLALLTSAPLASAAWTLVLAVGVYLYV